MFVRTAALLIMVLSLSALTHAPVPDGAPPGVAADSLLERADVGRTLGNPAATVWLIEAGDFECPVCRTWHVESFPTIEREYIRTGKIRFAFVNYPVAQHRNAVPAASAAMCAAAQGKFWPMHDALYARQTAWSAQSKPGATFREMANAVHVDLKEWNDCVSHERVAPLITADHDRLRDSGVHGTPTFFIGKIALPGDPGLPMLRTIIDSVLASGTR